MPKSKQKPASPKHAKKKAVRIKDVPAKELENREVLGAGALRSYRPPNLGM